ncbi:hypothetical protein EC950183_1928, partial [Escherichia coli 95.0183]
MLKEKIL